MEVSNIQDAVVTVMGLGRLKRGSGVGATKWLIRHGAQVVITDHRTNEELRESVDEVTRWFEEYRQTLPDRELYHPIFVLGEHREEDFTDVALVITNPDVPHDSPWVKMAYAHRVPVESDVSLFFQFCPYPVIGVTGARGKTTTTALIGELLKKKNPQTIVAGNMRVSPLEYLDEILAWKEPAPIVLELSSWLLESLDHLDRGPEVGVLTNMYADHLHRYASMEAYAASKVGVFAKGGKDGIAVLNADQDQVRGLAEKAPGRVVWFSLLLLEGKEGVCVKDGNVTSLNDIIMPVSNIHLEGDDNVRNVLAAIAVAKLYSVENASCAEVVKAFSSEDDRQEIVTDVSGVIYVNDALGSSAEATTNVLRRFGERGRSIHLISGGDVKEGNLDELAKVCKLVCKSVVLLPGAGSDAFEHVMGKTEEVKILRAENMPDAVVTASQAATSADAVIFSPALGYSDTSAAKQLGEAFAKAARELK
ncbi:UDP-N-acetylmuramoyl-L-alanine--D-glutamate ligase [Candidatus Uhrbacteria bacterium]|nr:UDP-N-acetylmuramoyl-L-alanine--D-glutamate ligase [Candidatus Uhrbacteria bacterium]